MGEFDRHTSNTLPGMKKSSRGKTRLPTSRLNRAVIPQLFEQVLDASGMAMAIRDTALTPVFTNQAFRALYGHTVEYIRDTPPEAVLPKGTQALYTNHIRPAMASGLNWEGTYDIRTETGGTRKVWSRFTPVLDDDGALTHVVSVMRDTANFKLMRQALSQTERHLNFLAENSSDCLFRIRLSDGRCDYIGSSVANVTGYSQQEFYGMPELYRHLFPDDWQETVREWWREFRQGFSRYEYELPLVHKNGTRKWVHQRIKIAFDDMACPTAIEGIMTDVTDRHKAEAALAAARKSLNFISTSTSDIFFRLNIPEGTYDYLSPSVQRCSGYSLEEFEAGPLFLRSIVHPDWQAYFQGIWDEWSQGKARSMYEFQFLHKSGEVRWLSQRVVLHKDEQGNPIAVEGIATDITERKAAEEAAGKNERRFRTLFEDSPISLWEEDLTTLKAYFNELRDRGVTDFRLHFQNNPEELTKCASLVKVVDVNKATLDLLGARNKEDLLGNLEKVMTESSMAAFSEEMIVLSSGGCEYCGEITHRTLKGDTIWVMIHFFVPPEYTNSLSRVIVSLLDVTPRKQAEEALTDSEERYRVLAENSQEGVLVIQNGQIKYINQNMTSIFGYDSHEFNKLKLISTIHPDDRDDVGRRIDRIASGRDPKALISCRAVTKAGEIKWLNLTAKPIMWNGEKARLDILTDITGHKKLEEELLRAHAEMEDRIRKRTEELSKANTSLKTEAEKRGKAQNRVLSLTQQLIRIQEDERQRISRDLHDNVAQDLSSIILKMETLFDDQNCVNDKLRDRGQDVTDILHRAIASVRDIAYGLRPPALEQLGVVCALKNLCEDVASKHCYNVDFFATGIEDIPMDFDAELNIYRMVQEAVRNISRHAEASKATIRMVKSHPVILIRIEDNGRGFDRDERLKKAISEKRMGVRSMEERARLIGGTMEIQSLPGTGTRVLFKIPIENARRRE